MSRPRLLLLHGWGFDASLWDDVCAALPEFAAIRADRGYFGNTVPCSDNPTLAIGHSLGALLLATELPLHIPLIAINGFDRFTGPDSIPPRVLARMQRRFLESPETVLTEFRARCGGDVPTPAFHREILATDLLLLGSLDARSTIHGRSLMVLHGAHDPILPPVMRNSVFAGSPRATHPDAGHLLPRTHPAWCAEQIRTLYRLLCP
ncbi:MAG: alpha/beta hydrolase [Sphingomonadaceae bacterium]